MNKTRRSKIPLAKIYNRKAFYDFCKKKVPMRREINTRI